MAERKERADTGSANITPRRTAEKYWTHAIRYARVLKFAINTAKKLKEEEVRNG
jgi:hypothetical protein